MTTENDKENGEMQSDIHLAEMNEQKTQEELKKQFEEQECFDSRFDVPIDHSALNTRFKVLGDNTWEKEKYVGTFDGEDVYRLTTVKWLESQDCYKVTVDDIIYEEVV